MYNLAIIPSIMFPVSASSAISLRLNANGVSCAAGSGACLLLFKDTPSGYSASIYLINAFMYGVQLTQHLLNSLAIFLIKRFLFLI